MTEGEWLVCADPFVMWEHLRGPMTQRLFEIQGRPTPMNVYDAIRLSERKSRLLAVAACRRTWEMVSEVNCRLLIAVAEGNKWFARAKVLPMPTSCRTTIEKAELAADEAVDPQDLGRSREACDALDHAGVMYIDCHDWDWTADDAAMMAAGDAVGAIVSASFHYPPLPSPFGGPPTTVFDELRHVFNCVPNALTWMKSERGGESDPAELVAICDLVRDIAGNPFRPVTLAPHFRTPTAVSVAQAAYDGRDPASGHIDPVRLAVLADALEEAGCDDGDILSHLRSRGPHVRGCWALDLVLGRE